MSLATNQAFQTGSAHLKKIATPLDKQLDFMQGSKVHKNQLLGDSTEFVCGICCEHVVGSSPVLTKCSHLFCGDCFNSWAEVFPVTHTWAQKSRKGFKADCCERSVPCPACEEVLDVPRDIDDVCNDSQSENLVLCRSMLSSVKLVCKNHPQAAGKDGSCNWIGDYGDYHNHVEHCQNAPVLNTEESAESTKTTCSGSPASMDSGSSSEGTPQVSPNLSESFRATRCESEEGTASVHFALVRDTAADPVSFADLSSPLPEESSVEETELPPNSLAHLMSLLSEIDGDDGIDQEDNKPGTQIMFSFTEAAVPLEAERVKTPPPPPTAAAPTLSDVVAAVPLAPPPPPAAPPMAPAMAAPTLSELVASVPLAADRVRTPPPPPTAPAMTTVQLATPPCPPPSAPPALDQCIAPSEGPFSAHMPPAVRPPPGLELHSGSVLPAPTAQQPLRAQALFGFNPTELCQIPVQAGEHFEIFDHHASGWCHCRSLSRPSHRSGWVPSWVLPPKPEPSMPPMPVQAPALMPMYAPPASLGLAGGPMPMHAPPASVAPALAPMAPHTPPPPGAAPMQMPQMDMATPPMTSAPVLPPPGISAPPSSPPLTKMPCAPAPSQPVVEVLHAFESTGPSFISVAPHELVEIFRRDKSGWTYGRKVGVADKPEGWFPAWACAQ